MNQQDNLVHGTDLTAEEYARYLRSECAECGHPHQSHDHIEGCVAPIETDPPSHETDVCPCVRRGG